MTKLWLCHKTLDCQTLMPVVMQSCLHQPWHLRSIQMAHSWVYSWVGHIYVVICNLHSDSGVTGLCIVVLYIFSHLFSLVKNALFFSLLFLLLYSWKLQELEIFASHFTVAARFAKPECPTTLWISLAGRIQMTFLLGKKIK